MNIDLSSLQYLFTSKPLLIGGKAKEYYDVRKSGNDTDLIATTEDFQALAKLYPDNTQDLWGDLGVTIYGFEIWKTIRLFNYSFLSEHAVEQDTVKIISLEKLLFLTAMAIEEQKYEKDLKRIVEVVMKNQYKDFDDSKYRS